MEEKKQLKDYEIYQLLTQSVGDRYYDPDDLEMDYDEENDEWVLWYNGNIDVAHYNPKTKEVY